MTDQTNTEATVTPITPATTQVRQLPPGASISLALARAQVVMRAVGKDRDVTVKSDKGSYKFAYATLSAIWAVIREPLASNGLSVVQMPTVDVKDWTVAVETRLLHASGEWMASTCTLPVAKRDVQGIGSAISYARRYAISAMLGVVSEEDDDDGEAASPHYQAPPTQVAQRPQATRAPPASPPKGAPSGPPISFAELEQQMRSCASMAELTKVAARAKGANLAGPDHAALLKVYTSCVEALK